MPQIIIESTRDTCPVRVGVVEISAEDRVYGLHCSGDPYDECPTAGFEPGDTWSNGTVDAIAAAEVHVAAHERRVCATCGQRQQWLGTGHEEDGEFVGRYGCPAGHGEVIR